MRRSIQALFVATALLLALALVLPAAADEPTGNLVLSSRPRAQVHIDGVPYGSADDTRGGVRMAPGTYTVRFVCDHEDCEGFDRRSGVKTLTVEADKETRYLTDFFALNDRSRRPREPAEVDESTSPVTTRTDGTGLLVLSARPVCDVEIDGSFVGTSDDTRKGLRLEPGTYRIRYVCSDEACAGLERRSGVKTLKVEEGKETRYIADFFALNSR